MKVSPRDRMLLTMVAAALVVFALIASLVYPQVRQLGRLTTQVAEATAQADAAKLQLDQRAAFKDRAVETNAKWLRLMNRVPDTPDLPSLIIELQDTAFKSGVNVLTVTPTQPSAAPAGTYQLLPVSLSIVGSWTDTIDYLQALMKLDRGVRLVNVEVAIAGPSPEFKLAPYSLNSAITLETYVIPSAPASPTATPAPAP